MIDPSTQMQMEPEPMEPGLAAEPEVGLPELAPIDPADAAIDSILDLPGQDAIRRVYQLATSAARAKARIEASADRLDAKTYHDLLSQSPEARYASELIAARRRLDTLAQERRRLNLEMAKAGAAANPMHELQVAGINLAMEQVAGGMLLFLVLPSIPGPPSPPPTQEPLPPLTQQEEPGLATEPEPFV